MTSHFQTQYLAQIKHTLGFYRIKLSLFIKPAYFMYQRAHRKGLQSY